MRAALLSAFLCLVACGDKDADSGSTDGTADGADGTADGADGTADGTDGTADGTDGGDAAAGGEIFSATCANCHGADGASGYAADLTVRVPEMTNEQITTVVLEGQNYMPDQSLDATQVADVLAHLRVTFGG